MGAKRYQKKATIEAFQLTEERSRDNTDWPDWARAAWDTPADQEGALRFCTTRTGAPGFIISTKEGDLASAFGGWVVRGVDGELYPIDEDIFDRTYEEVPE